MSMAVTACSSSKSTIRIPSACGSCALIRFADLHIDPVRQQVWRQTGGAREPLPVHGLSLQLLLKLLQHGTEIVSADQLISEVWAPAIVNEETVTQRVKLLRQALGDDGRAPRLVCP